MKTITIEKFCMEVAIPWKGNSIYMIRTMSETMNFFANGEGESDWGAYGFLKELSESKAELNWIKTRDEKLVANISFQSKKDFEDFCEKHGT